MRQPRSTCLTESGPVQVRTERCGWTRFVETGHHQGRQHPALGQGLRLQPPTAIEPKFRPGQSPGAQPSASRPNGGPAVGGGYPPPAYRRRSALISLRNPVAIACPFQACASAIAAPVCWRRVGASAAGVGASAASLSCSRSGSCSAVVIASSRHSDGRFCASRYLPVHSRWLPPASSRADAGVLGPALVSCSQPSR